MILPVNGISQPSIAKEETTDDTERSTMLESDDDLSSYCDESSVDSDFSDDEEPTQNEKKSGLFLSLQMVQALRVSTSDGNLNALIQDSSIQRMIPRTGSVKAVQGKMVFALQTKNTMVSNNRPLEGTVPTPKEYLISLLSSGGIDYTTQTTSSQSINYVQGTSSGYTMELMSAVKKGDLDYLRSLWTNGKRNFQHCNRFGESIVHAAARHGRTHILKFLSNEADVSLLVKCDTGRTPLHDACWTGTPNFDCVTFIIETSPELLFVIDNKKFMPLEYIPKDMHQTWNQYLERNKQTILRLYQKEIANVN
jgi:hypothetical protein